MKKRLLVSLLLTALFVCSLGTIAFAAGNDPELGTPENPLQPRYSYTSAMAVSGGISRSSGKLIFDVSVDTYEKCNVYIKTEVQRLDNNGWTTVATFRNPASGSASGTSFLYENSCYVSTNYTYRLVASAEVTSVRTGYSDYPSATQNSLPYN